MHVPHSVLTELDSRLELLSKLQPKSALANADLLWATEFYEVKHSAISILAGLSSTQQNPVIERIRNWITHDLDQRLMIEILDAFKNQPDILLNDQWIDSLSQWLSGSDDDIRRIGLKAIQETIRMNYKNLPKIFKLLNPVFQNPRISYQKELVDVIRVLIERSEAETASFMIMTATLYPNKDVRAFVRKCLPMFDPFFQVEIRSHLTQP